MKRFIVQSSVFTILVLLTITWVFSQADGYSDPFYLRFTTTKQSSMILGTSRAAQDIQPKVLEEQLGKKIYNYAFTVAHSPFGPTYLKSIKKKIDRNSVHDIFIVSIDPWSISSWANEANDYRSFRELDRCVGTTWLVSMNPNPLYLLNNWNEKYLDILTKSNRSIFLHDDGWLDISIDMDSSIVNQRTKDTEKLYRNDYLVHAKFSELRLHYLLETVRFLQQEGKVYLVRLPMHPKIMQIENELMPDFNAKVREVVSISDGYLDLTDQNEIYEYTDGSHLYKDSGLKVSKIIGDWIKESQF